MSPLIICKIPSQLNDQSTSGQLPCFSRNHQFILASSPQNYIGTSLWTEQIHRKPTIIQGFQGFHGPISPNFKDPLIFFFQGSKRLVDCSPTWRPWWWSPLLSGGAWESSLPKGGFVVWSFLSMDRVFHGFSSKNGGFFVEICDNTKCDLQLSNTHTHAW
jgi:hypothetical protein